MYNPKNGTPCTECAHKEVCSLKEKFKAAQTAVDQVTVNLPAEPDSNKHAFIHLRDIKWIKPVDLVCVHFIANSTSTFRDTACSTAAQA